jgi:dipeptidyl aminopeptidase/acylaminoacyl peptidase
MSAESIASKALALDELQVFEDMLFWLESGRSGSSITSWSPQHGAEAHAFSAGSSAHSYGGGSFTVLDGVLFAVESGSGQIANVEKGNRVTDYRGQFGALTTSEDALIAVCDSGSADQLVEVDPHSGAVRILHRAPFLASPTVHRRRIAWAQWPEDAAPWNHCETWTAEYLPGQGIASPVRLAGGAEESAIEPRWGPDGSLYFLSDRTGWWNLYRWKDGVTEPVAPVEADCAAAPWELGYASYAFLASGRIAMLARKGPPARLLLVEVNDQVREIALPYTSIKPYFAALGERVALIGSSSSTPAQIALIDPDGPDGGTVVRASEAAVPESNGQEPEIRTIESDGQAITLVFHPPRNHPGGPVPTIVRAHPGPTHHVEMRLDADLWYYTDQGFAVIDVDYRGSTGYGRAFRSSLYGHWGDYDAIDCANAARWAVDTGRSAPGHVFILGASAGGFTALNAAGLSNSPFALAVARSAVVDPEKWIAATPRFHRPNARALGGAPVRADRMGVPVLLIHGDDDKVVPIDDVVDLADALRRAGKPVDLLRFPEGGHYLSGAMVKAKVLEAEVDAFRAALSSAPPASGTKE